MTVFTTSAPLDPSALPLTKIAVDWFGSPLATPARFAFAIDDECFHFVARHDRTAHVHPASSCGVFQAELWKYDVAEFFLRHPDTGHYLEFNLAPNGGWWSCILHAPLQRISETDEPLPGVRTAVLPNSAGWTATAALPLSWLREHLNFGPRSRLNATFILESPRQRFLTASPLGAGEPAFHQPDLFPPIRLTPLS